MADVPIGLGSFVETDVASAATCDIGAATTLKVRITGTTTITSFGTSPGRIRFIRFEDVLTLTHHAVSLILPTAANIVTTAGDTCMAWSGAGGNWIVVSYQRKSGEALAPTTTINSNVRINAKLGFNQAPTNDFDFYLAGSAVAQFASDVGMTLRPERYSADSGGPVVSMVKGRGTKASPGQVISGDVLGEWQFRGWDNTGTPARRTGATIYATAMEAFTSAAAGTRVIFQAVLSTTLTLTEVFRYDATNGIQFGGAFTVIDMNRHFRLRSYTVGTLPSASPAAMMIYVSDGTSNKRLAVSDGTNWRWPDGAVVS
jgi:hypothetical protein